MTRTPATFETIHLPNGLTYEQPTGLFINNEFVKASHGKTTEVINPATEEIITYVSSGSRDDVERVRRRVRLPRLSRHQLGHPGPKEQSPHPFQAR